MDAISFLKREHAAVERLFKQFERATTTQQRGRLAQQIVRELSMHASIEEQLVYPRLRASTRDGVEDRVLDALEEHHATKVTLAEIDAMPPSAERFRSKVHVVIEAVRMHVKEEERELLPVLRRALSPADLRELGTTLAKAKALAPTRPHPTAPDQPPGSLPANAAAAAYDRSKDAVGRAMEAARDLLGEALRAGERVAQRARRQLEGAARDARKQIGVAARDAQDVARSARNAAKRTARDAQDVARSAQNAARRTAGDMARVARESAEAGLQ
jgi:hemerythrin superfamily protein